MIANPLEIRVLDANGAPVAGATVQAVPEAHGNEAMAQWDGVREVYGFKGLRPGFYRVAVSHPSYESQAKRVQVHPKPTEEAFTLVNREGAYLIRANARAPYQSDPDLLGVIPAPRRVETIAADEAGEMLADLFERLNLVIE